MYQFNPFAIPPFFTALFVLGLGTFVFSKNKKAMPNITFGLLYLSTAIWHFGFAMEYLSKTQDTALFWNRFVYLGVIFIPPNMYHFSVAFLHLKKQRKFVFLFYFLAIIFLLLSRTDYFITTPRKYFWGYYTKVNLLHHPFLITWFIPGIVGLVNLFKGCKTTDSALERQRRRHMFLSLAVAFIATLDFLAAYGIPLYPFGYLLIIICLSIFAYALLKYRIMDITVTITRTGVFVAVYTLVLGLPFVLMTLGKTWLIGFLGENWWMAPLILLVGLAIVGPFIYIYLEKRAEAILLREQHRYQETLKQAAREIARIRNLKKLLNLIAHLVTKTVRIFHSAIYLYDTGTDQFLLKAGRNLKKDRILSIDKNSALVSWLQKYQEPLVYEEIMRRSEEELNPIFKKLEEDLRYLKAALVIPGFLEYKLVGFLILGDKRSGKIYSQEDLHTFFLLANQAALAIENASLYENMEDQVRQRTKELLEVQKQLVQAEKLATVGTLAGGVAHEINNPLTAILTNVQMLLATNPIDSKLDRESLELIEEATKRCRTIVQKLMTYAKKPLETAQVSEVNLLSALKNVISFLDYQLGQDNIKIITEAKGNDYSVMGNQNELEQVLTNIILNAKDAIKQIKKSGNIHILLSKGGDWIKLAIKDDGVGIPQEILSKIFDPFFTTKEVGKGTGLGLSICQAIVEKYNGMITVQSEPRKGSVFTIQLPKAVMAKAP